MNKHRPISCSSDKTIRLWKMVDETHLVFRGHKGSVDAVRMLTKDSFISGGQDGSLLLWKETQKRPIASIACAHGMEGDGDHDSTSATSTSRVPRWICSLTSIHSSDLVLSGSYDGKIKFWNANVEGKGLNLVNSLNLQGFVNSLAISSSSRLLVAGTGNEHKMGRWWRLPGSHNKVVIMRLPNLDILSNDDEYSNNINSPKSNDDSSVDDGNNSDDDDNFFQREELNEGRHQSHKKR